MNNLNIVVPIIQDENIQSIIDSCMVKEGLNKNHSRTIKPINYQKPVEGPLTKESEKHLLLAINIEVLKYYCSKCLYEINKSNGNLSDLVIKYVPNFSNKEINGYDLQRIINSSENDFLKIINRKCTTPYEMFIYSNIINNSIEEEHCSNFSLYSIPSISDETEELYGWGPDSHKYSKRIYMNLPAHSTMTYKFGVTFIERCIDKNIPFDMKLTGALGHSINELDSTIFYSRNAYFEEHIKILRDILKDYPEYKRFFGSPITTAGNIIEDDSKSFIAISHSGNCFYSRMGQTFNDTSNTVINMTYIYSCCKLIKYYYAYFINKLDRETLTEIKIVLNNELSIDTFDLLKKIETPVRKAVYEFNNYKKNSNETIDFLLGDYIKENINTFSSLVNFGDLDHKDYPMYEDKSFTPFHKEENKTKQ